MSSDTLSQLLTRVKNERTKRLTRIVWRKLPKHDRAILSILISGINEATHIDNAFASAGCEDPSFMLGNPAQIVEDISDQVSLPRIPEIQSDVIAQYIIAHEFAHVILRHSQMGILVGVLRDLTYTPDDIDSLTIWNEEQADLQAWIWGFKEGMQAFLETYPTRQKPRWYVEIEEA